MKILNYLQAREVVNRKLDEELQRRILTISGRAKEWIDKISQMVAKSDRIEDVGIVETSGMGRTILQQVPKEEWVYLLNPSLAPSPSYVVRESVVQEGKLFSKALGQWLLAQEIGLIYTLSERNFTQEEAKMMRLLWRKQEEIVEREEVAQAVWGDNWSDKYTDWGIDALAHRVRRKLGGRYQLMTIKGRGYMLLSGEKPSLSAKMVLSKSKPVTEIPFSIYPSCEYLTYMNDPKNIRKTYRDLWQATKNEGLFDSLVEGSQILCVNSYSYDNVDFISSLLSDVSTAKAYFVHYDPRAIEMHSERVRELGTGRKIEVLYDDLRESKILSESMDLVINDFRLNFNQNDAQNTKTLKHVFRILKKGGKAIFSTVVDGRYENTRYGLDQEKAPVNANKPGTFQADEHLVRRCWSVPYYRQLFEKSGFSETIEFDIDEGKRWGAQPTLTVNPWQGPYFRRWMLTK